MNTSKIRSICELVDILYVPKSNNTTIDTNDTLENNTITPNDTDKPVSIGSISEIVDILSASKANQDVIDTNATLKNNATSIDTKTEIISIDSMTDVVDVLQNNTIPLVFPPITSTIDSINDTISTPASDNPSISISPPELSKKPSRQSILLNRQKQSYESNHCICSPQTDQPVTIIQNHIELIPTPIIPGNNIQNKPVRKSLLMRNDSRLVKIYDI